MKIQNFIIINKNGCAEQCVSRRSLPFGRYRGYAGRSAPLPITPFKNTNSIKKLVHILLIIVFFGCSSKTNHPDKITSEVRFIEQAMDKFIVHKNDLGLNSEVKYIFEYASNLNNDFIVKSGNGKDYLSDEFWMKTISEVFAIYADVFIFDEHGFLIKEINYLNVDKYSSQKIKNYIYDENHNLIENNEYEFPKENVSKNNFSYNQDNKVIAVISQKGSSDEIFQIDIEYLNDTIIFYHYKIMEEDTFELEKSLMNRSGIHLESDTSLVKFYDDRQNLIKIEFNEKADFLNLSAVTYDYDSRNNKVKETEYDTLNRVTSSEMNYYDEKNRLYQQIKLDSSSTEIQRFDQYGNLQEYIFSPTSEVRTKFHGFWKNYDEHNNVIKEVEFEKDSTGNIIEEIIEFQYEYDKFNNWTERRVISTDTIKKNSKRKISYF